MSSLKKPASVLERQAFEQWYETNPCFGIEPTWAAWLTRASMANDELAQAVLAEREACAQIAEEWLGPVKDRELHIADAIRNRVKYE